MDERQRVAQRTEEEKFEKVLTGHRTLHASHAQNFSRAWLKRTSCIFFVCCPKIVIVSRVMSSALSTLTSSSLLFPQSRTTTCTPPTGLLFGRFAEESPLTEGGLLLSATILRIAPQMNWNEVKLIKPNMNMVGKE